jgi:uncharacterized protein involved in exopolysaccharide biosynthesis
VKDQNQIDLASFIAIIRRRRWLVLGVALAAAVLATGLSLLQADRYEASADLQFRQDERIPSVDPAEPPPDPTESPERIAATNLALASLDKVAARVRERLNSNQTIEEVRDSVDLEPQGQADIVRITAEGPTAREAARAANVFAAEVVAVRREASQAKVQRVIDAIEIQLAGASSSSKSRSGSAPGMSRSCRRRSRRLIAALRSRSGTALSAACSA